MNKKICFFDIDGTLASIKRNSMPESTIKTLDKLKENGVLVFINSGRMYSELPKFVRDYVFDGYILGCGMQAIMHNKVIFYNKFPAEMDLQEAYDRAIALGFDCAFESNQDGALFCGHGETLETVKKSFIASGSKIGESTEYKPYEKFVIYTTDLKLADEYLRPYYPYVEYSKVQMGKFGLYEMVPKGCTKANGMKEVLKILEIDYDNVYVFGDSGNDLPMLQLAKHSIVLANGSDEAKKYAEYVTTLDCDNGGIEEACKHYNLI